MVLHAQSGLVIAPALLLNGLALCGGWLLLATQWRETRALRRPLVASALETASTSDGATQRVNQLFNRVGGVGLLLGLGLSMASRLL
ncbi:hypothetical protein [Stutzerimonas kunmingensis]|uniref:hypothetical protein n=1 Tax=Stutzerimonas kunmingensis TaxID=1211807 RepID=UPI0028A792AB|nr:hypothetical protein [Stutzerimonas kunmingensis]